MLGHGGEKGHGELELALDRLDPGVVHDGGDVPGKALHLLVPGGDEGGDLPVVVPAQGVAVVGVERDRLGVAPGRPPTV